MDAKTRKGDGVAGLKCLSVLKDFQTGTASMVRKRHLALSARGFSCFCLTSTTELIRLIRGRKESSFTADTGCRK